jgi:glutaryl-CoA dehydrogenase
MSAERVGRLVPPGALATAELTSSYLLALHIGKLADRGQLRPEQISGGKLHNVTKALAIVRESRTILGASGITLDYPMLRHALNLESVLIHEGTAEVHTPIVGQALTGIGAFR